MNPISRAFGRYRPQIANATYLGMTSLANLVVPVLILSLLNTALEVEEFSTVLLAMTLCTILASACDYGFAWSAARRISIHRDEPQVLSETFAAVTVARFVVFGVLAAIVGILIVAVPPFSEEQASFSFCILFMLGTVMQPLWFLQGLERLRLAMLAILAFRIATLVVSWAMLSGAGDGILFLIVYATANLSAGLVTFFIAWRRLTVRPAWPARSRVAAELAEGWQVFQAFIGATIYTSATVFFIDHSLGATAVAAYGAAERIVRGSCQVIAPVSQAFYPLVSAQLHHDRAAGRRNIAVLAAAWGIAAALGSAGLWFAAPWLCQVIFVNGSIDVEDAARLLRLMAPIPCVLMLGTAFSTWYMLSTRAYGQWRVMVLGALGVYLLSAVMMTISGLASDSAFALLQVVVEGFILIYSFIYFISGAGRSAQEAR